MGKGHRLINLVGNRFGRLVVESRAHSETRGAKWHCVCDCGKRKSVGGQALREGKTLSCGCFNREQNVKRVLRDFPDPKSYKPEYKLWESAKHRAKRDGLEFNLDYRDIVIPTYCPVLGTKLKHSTGSPSDDSPTLDKVIPSLGYVKGNVNVISFKANSIKRDATAEEIQKVLRYVEQHKVTALMHQ